MMIQKAPVPFRDRGIAAVPPCIVLSFLSITGTAAFTTFFAPVLMGEFALCSIPACTIRRLSAMAFIRLFPNHR
uniref:hypothetical protein n=1 Tax=Dialister succinatiphilus TaxID=487173 RepID=UPI0040386CD6